MANITLNINNTGDKPIYYNGNLVTSDDYIHRKFCKDLVYEFMYDEEKDAYILCGEVNTLATLTNDGLMSWEDKYKLSEIESGANKTVVDDALSDTSTNPVQNKIVNAAITNKVSKVDGKGLSTNDFTDDEKSKLSNIEAGANKTVVDSALSSTSTNPVQNKVIKAYVDALVIDDGSID